MTIKNIAKRAIPDGIWRRLKAWRWSRDAYRSYFQARVDAIYPTMLATGEIYNLTYDVTDETLRYMAEMIAIATARTPVEIENYINEALTDRDLHAAAATANRPDLRSPFGRRLGWYAVTRAMKPRVIVETGVADGLGSLMLCAALTRNADEGAPGRHYGTDINPNAGKLLAGKYAAWGEILYGDSIETLKTLGKPIDLFINDSDHSAEYEYEEYLTVENDLAPGAIILGDNAEVTDKLAVYSRQKGRPFLFIPEKPRDHWFPGGGIGISLPPMR